MSIEALNIMNNHRNVLFANSSFSERFNVGGFEFDGIYDESHLEDHASKMTAHISQKKLTPRILVAEIPTAMIPRTTKITRVSTGDIYTLLFVDVDKVGISVLWLF